MNTLAQITACRGRHEGASRTDFVKSFNQTVSRRALCLSASHCQADVAPHMWMRNAQSARRNMLQVMRLRAGTPVVSKRLVASASASRYVLRAHW
eukprot:9492594-Pyramimonas_sp.AAC.1